MEVDAAVEAEVEAEAEAGEGPRADLEEEEDL